MKKFLLLFLIFLFLYCTKKGKEENPARELTEKGWVFFAEGNYDSALYYFREAYGIDPYYADAFNGAGWALLNLEEFDESEARFYQALSKDENMRDPYAGIAIIHSEIEPYESTIVTVDTLLRLSPNYSFSRDPRVDAFLLKVLKARCYAKIGDFEGALTILEVLLPGFYADPSTPEGRSLILNKIEELIETHYGGI